MPAFFVYVPNVQGCDPEHLTRAGLPGLVGPNTPSLIATEVLRGPDAGRGVAYTWRQDSAAYKPEEQDWTPFPPTLPPTPTPTPTLTPSAERGDGGKSKSRSKSKSKSAEGEGNVPCEGRPAFYLGRWRDKPILPDDLARPKQHAGEFVELADGQPWLVPIARQLPHVNGLDGSGNHRRTIRREFADYFDRAGKYLDGMVELAVAGKTGQSMAYSDLWPFACRALALNYLLAPGLVSWLELIDDEHFAAILRAACNVAAIEEAMREKKRP